MNLAKLFEMQKELDGRIIREKGLEGQDLLPQKILALQVELGELANEWRGFKFWSEDQEPRTKMHDFQTWRRNGYPMNEEGKAVKCYRNPLLEEYVDCLHFILSIGNDFGVNKNPSLTIVPKDITEQFNNLFENVSFMYCAYKSLGYVNGAHDFYEELLENFFLLGVSLGFAWNVVERAYMEKNKVNHQRQEEGY